MSGVLETGAGGRWVPIDGGIYNKIVLNKIIGINNRNWYLVNEYYVVCTYFLFIQSYVQKTSTTIFINVIGNSFNFSEEE